MHHLIVMGIVTPQNPRDLEKTLLIHLNVPIRGHGENGEKIRINISFVDLQQQISNTLHLSVLD